MSTSFPLDGARVRFAGATNIGRKRDHPPLIGGIGFTRQGRCQEREEVLGTTKPPYTLARSEDSKGLGIDALWAYSRRLQQGYAHWPDAGH